MEKEFDVIVIGGGPAGIMAAIKSSEKARVALVEKNPIIGKKLLITGNKRCNLAQAEFNHKKIVEKFGKKGKFLFSPLSIFGPKETIGFFEKRGLKTKIERGKRVFPLSEKSQDVLRSLKKTLKKNKVEIFLNEKITKFNIRKKKIESIELGNKKISAKSFILATGGKAYPGTGSTGDGYNWAKKMGHNIISLKPALVPIKIKENWAKGLTGLTLKNVKVSVFKNDIKKDSRFGEMLFTHFGVSGPIILDLGKRIGELGKVKLKIDLKPVLDFKKLDQRFQRDFKGNKNFKNYLPEIVPQKMITTILRITKISPNKKINSITKEERKNIVKTLKGLELTTDGLLGFNQAIITSGGIDLKEIDSKTMRSKIIDNLFFAGEIIDLDGPTGGYNLQVCWTTGYIAGIEATKNRAL